jgi:DNA-binding CsgD family transcriptional regulator
MSWPVPDILVLFPRLTPTQAAVAGLFIFEGMSNKEVGLKLGISPRTVEDHRNAIYKKMDVHNAAHLVHKVYQAVLREREQRDGSEVSVSDMPVKSLG